MVWDSFTHGDGFVVQHVAWLREPLLGDLTAARVLQHASTVLGLAALAAWGLAGVRRWIASGTWRVGRRRALLVAALAAAGVVGAVVGVVTLLGESASPGLESVLSAAAKTGGTTAVAAVLLYAAVWWVIRRD
ncbi:DUF4184 family protein [Serinibacter arcticus]|uniref:DUF4184 family protein n=1 Tax=Serinibacter arcticus TaxID=1655435 RepID=UPI0026ACDF99